VKGGKMNLAKAFSEKLNDPNLSEDYTIDDFYDEVGIPKEQRSDFATAAIIKQALEMGPKYVYVILNETDISGAWDDPREAVKSYFKHDMTNDERIEHRNSIYTIDEMVEKMLDEMSDYPVLGKIAVNPSGDDVWKLDR